MNSETPSGTIPGQLNPAERTIITSAVLDRPTKPKIVLEVGTWLGGGSTLHLLRALARNNEGHLWGIEADRSIYDQMLANLKNAAPDAIERFTPLFGRSDDVIPRWLNELGPNKELDVAFLDGGDNPLEQITEFKLLAPRMPVGGRLLAHDAKLRKGKWLVGYLPLLDNWRVQLHDLSEEGLLEATKIRAAPSAQSRRAAERKLMMMRLAPIELVGRFLPKKLCEWILQSLPPRLAARLSQGRP